MIEIIEPESVGLSSGCLKEIDATMQTFVYQGKSAGIATMISRRGTVAHDGGAPNGVPLSSPPAIQHTFCDMAAPAGTDSTQRE